MRYPALARALLGLSALFPACVSEPDPGNVIQLPEGVDRFIDEPTELRADRVLIQAVRQYRAEVVPVLTPGGQHTKEITPDRIHLVNRARVPGSVPVALNFRDMRVEAREELEVRFSDKPLLEQREDAVVLLFLAEGVASLRGPGYDVVAERIELRNDAARALGKDGRPWELPEALR